MKKYKYHISALVVSLIIFGHSFLWPQDQSSDPLPAIVKLSATNITPMTIDGPLKTWHLGKINLMLPEEIKPGIFKYTFHIQGFGSGKYLEFSETRVNLHDDKSKLLFDTQKIPGKDISSEIGRPAGLRVYPSLRKSGQDTKQDLWFNGKIKDQESFLNFLYKEQVEMTLSSEQFEDLAKEREQRVINILKEFLADYKWTGDNEPPGKNEVATKYGYFTVDGDITSLGMDMNYTFNTEKPDERLEIIITLQLPPKNTPGTIAFGTSEIVHYNYFPYCNKVELQIHYLSYVHSEVYGEILINVMIKGTSNKDSKRFPSYVMGAYEHIQKQLEN